MCVYLFNFSTVCYWNSAISPRGIKKDYSILYSAISSRWWYSDCITAKEQHCSRDTELLAVSMQPYYLPCDLPHVIMPTVYSPPSANTAAYIRTVDLRLAGEKFVQFHSSHSQSQTPMQMFICQFWSHRFLDFLAWNGLFADLPAVSAQSNNAGKKTPSCLLFRAPGQMWRRAVSLVNILSGSK